MFRPMYFSDLILAIDLFLIWSWMKKNTSGLSSRFNSGHRLGTLEASGNGRQRQAPFQGLQPSNSDLDQVLTGFDCFP